MMEMVRKKGLDLFKYSTFWKGVKFGRSVNDKQMHGNRVQKSRRRQECQELTSKMCWPNIESGPSALTLMFYIRPSPMYVSVSVKLESHYWVCDETKQAILIVDLADFLVGTHKSICEHVAWKHRWVIGDTILLHGCFTFFTPLRAQGCRNSLASEELFAMSHAAIYEQDKTWWHMNFRAHTTNAAK